MAQYKVFKLNFQTPLHIGLGRDAYDSSSSDLHSDTLTAALAAIKAQRGASSSEVLNYLESLTMSSAFPFEDDMFFLPRPLTADKILIDGEDSVEQRKKLKKVRYIESSVWGDFVGSSAPSICSSQLKGAFVTPLSCKDFVKPFETQVLQRVQVPREDGIKTDPFFFEWCYFNSLHRCGFYVIVDSDENVIAETKSLLEELGQTGIGTDKTVGGGQFEVEEGVIDLPVCEGDHWVSLSLYLPTKEEQTTSDIQNSCYNILRRGGFIAGSIYSEFRHLWKKSIYMYEEGSVFKSSRKLKGNIVDLRPQWDSPNLHPVYRSGKAFFIPVNIEKP